MITSFRKKKKKKVQQPKNFLFKIKNPKLLRKERMSTKEKNNKNKKR